MEPQQRDTGTEPTDELASLRARVAELSAAIEQSQRDQERLQQAEQRLFYAMDAIAIGVWDLDLRTGNAWRSARHAEIFGVDYAEPWTYQRFLSHVLPGHRLRVQCVTSDAVATGKRWEVECPIQRSDGQIRWVRIAGNPRPDEQGQIERVLGLVRDITEERQAAEYLKRINERFALATSAAGIGIWEYDPVSGALMWDQQMRRLHGLEDSSPANTLNSWNAAVHPDDWPRVEQALARALTSDQEFRVDVRAVWPDLTIHTLHLFALIQRDDSGTPSKLLGTCWDISEGRAVEDNLRYTLNDLEQFAFASSHDLLEPLRKITYAVGLINQDTDCHLSPVAEAEMLRIKTSALRMKLMIDGLLRYAMVSTKKFPLKSVDLNYAVKRTIRVLEPVIAASGIELRVEKLPKVKADAGLMRQLFLHLLDNAIKFRRHDDAAWVRVYHLPQPEGSCARCIAIEDNGIGFDQTHAERLFGVFQRLHKSGEFEGSGIGLALCRRIAERCGGSISVVSQPQTGTTFTVTLLQG